MAPRIEKQFIDQFELGEVDDSLLQEGGGDDRVYVPETEDESKSYRTSGYDLGDIQYSDKSLGPTLLEVMSGDDKRLDLIFDVYREWYRTQSHPTSWTNDLEHISWEEKKELGLLYQEGKMDEIPDEILRKNFDAVLENLNTMIFASMGEEILEREHSWSGDKDAAKWKPNYTMGGIFKEGKSLYRRWELTDLIGEPHLEKSKGWFADPDTSFYSHKKRTLHTYEEMLHMREKIGTLFHESILHSSGGKHHNRPSRIEKTGQGTYKKYTNNFLDLLSDEEISKLFGLMYPSDVPEEEEPNFLGKVWNYIKGE